MAYSFYYVSQQELQELEARWKHSVNRGVSFTPTGKRQAEVFPVNPENHDSRDRLDPSVHNPKTRLPVYPQQPHSSDDNPRSSIIKPASPVNDSSVDIHRLHNAASLLKNRTGINNLDNNNNNNIKKRQAAQSLRGDLAQHGANLVNIGHSEDAGYKAQCPITHKDALLAIERATSNQCKQQIADVACLEKRGELYPKGPFKSSCPLRNEHRGEYLGCYQDSKTSRLFEGFEKKMENNSPENCINLCLMSGHEYVGVQWGVECWCAEKFVPSEAVKLAEAACDKPCPGSTSRNCGGFLTMNVYRSGAGARNTESPELVEPADLDPSLRRARIAFVLTLNGRALRQVRRLLKALYHTDHYYLVHVDSRQDYLFREVSRAVAALPNVRMMPYRFATIWGGANLATMLLRCMEYLLLETDWQWDFFMNLSESDFPIRSLEELVAFLTVHLGKNFLKSHGKDTPRFIQKQGLDRTFVQCDHHMWRVGNRKLPTGIRIDGGSDWIVTSRDFCDYLVTSQDQLIASLRPYWEYTLLPGESYFHTVLQNSQFCGTAINNNLHVVNWNRRKGCKCQYKAIVDWCGCSPNDFLAPDLRKFTQIYDTKKVVFLGRKFEAIVNQEVITELDAYLHGSYPQDLAGLSSYWESAYHHEDMVTDLINTTSTFYHTFGRLATQHLSRSAKGREACVLTPGRVLETTVYKQSDTFQGLVVTLEVSRPGDPETYTMETYLHYQRQFNVKTLSGPITRLKNVEIGTGFDPKEEIFRNWGGLLGPHSQFTVGIAWDSGKEFKVTVVVVDPANEVAVSMEETVAKDAYVQSLKPDLLLPLRPGVWTVKLLYLWQVVAETYFLVTPYSHYGGRPIQDAEATRLHRGPDAGVYQRNQDFNHLRDRLNLDDPNEALMLARLNSQRSGSALRNWIDELTSQFWRVADSCVVGERLPLCSKLPSCKATRWSTFSPDPKSELGEIDPETGRFVRHR